jgi:16S rRNA C1402 (ribose-2'-O) methylase RsmI
MFSKNVDAVICEEYRQGSRLLNQLEIENELVILNEHNEVTESPKFITRLGTG